MTFSIRPIDRRQAQSVEALGSKPKFWFLEDDRRLLFKAEDRGTGEDWAEVIACHLCGLIGLPHVEYELASEYDGKEYVRPGVVCENMAPAPESLVLGNQLLLAGDPAYPTQQRFKVRQHNVSAVAEILGNLHPPADRWCTKLPAGIKSAVDVFVGYILLDAWIANQDRHHENWGALWDGRMTVRLAPTFDHGAALARNLLDSEREERLATNDQLRTIAAFARRGRSAFYGTAGNQRPLGLQDAFSAFAARAPAAAQQWISQLRAVQWDAVWSILDQVPAERMSDLSKRFTAELLAANQERLTN